MPFLVVAGGVGWQKVCWWGRSFGGERPRSTPEVRPEGALIFGAFRVNVQTGESPKLISELPNNKVKSFGPP
jgi:hypothetical protein